MSLNKSKKDTGTEKVRKWQNEYMRTVFLVCIEENSSEFEICHMKCFDSNKRIISNKILLNELVREKYVERKESLSIISTVEGRKLLSDVTVTLTEKGKRFLEARKDFIAFYNFATQYADITDYCRTKNKMKKDERFEAVMITMLLNKIDDLEDEDDYVGVKNLHYDIGKLYEQIGYKPQALYHYLTALYFDVNGLEYYESFLKFIENTINDRQLRRTYEGIYIDYSTMQKIKEYGDIYYDDMVDSVYKKNPVRMNLCTKKKFKELVSDVINGNYSYCSWQNYFKEAFNKMIIVAEGYRT